jgi:hypothetical protein
MAAWIESAITSRIDQRIMAGGGLDVANALVKAFYSRLRQAVCLRIRPEPPDQKFAL